MKKILLIIPIVILIAAGCNNQKSNDTIPTPQTNEPIIQDQSAGKTKSETGEQQTYTDTRHGFQLQYPNTWNFSQEAPNLFTFTTHQGYTARFGIDPTSPFDTAGKTALLQNTPTHKIMIGTEQGLMSTGIARTTASFQFFSDRMHTKKFSFFLTIPGLTASEINNAPQVNGGKDPYPLFREEMKEVEKVLETLTFNQ